MSLKNHTYKVEISFRILCEKCKQEWTVPEALLKTLMKCPYCQTNAELEKPKEKKS